MSQNKEAKILLIDDDESFFNLINFKVMSVEGLNLLWAKDGKEGILKAHKEMPDLIITDIMMPNINGFDVLKKLKEKPSTNSLKFMVLSNFGEPRNVYEKDFLNSLGICKYLIKSNHTPSEIVNEIWEAIG